MRFRKCFISLLLILAICTVTFASALADVESVVYNGDGTVDVRFNSNDDVKMLLVWKTGDDFSADFDRYGYYWVPIDGQSRITSYDFAPGQSYWVLTENNGSGYTDPYPYEAARVSNFNEFNTPPKFAIFEMKKRDASGKITDPTNFVASELEDPNNYDSIGFRFYVTWPHLRNSREYVWQFVFELPDGYRHVFYGNIVDLPAGGDKVWGGEYVAIEDFFHLIQDMRREVPRGQYKYSLFWNGQHVSTQSFNVR